MLDKKRTLHLADYLVEYGIEVEDVILSQSGHCKIICFDNNDEIQNIIAQFNEDYGKS